MQSISDQQSGPASNELTERIRRVVDGLPPLSLGENEPPLHLTLQTLMELFKVPGLSLAVIEDYKIAWARGFGVTEAGGNTPVTERTLFQAGSVSKPVAAAGALALVAQGKLALDEDVNQKLVSWQVPENEYTREQKVTLRRILTHTAGFSVHGFPGYAVDEPVPSLVQVLNGEAPANTKPSRVESVPGAQWRYAGGGTLVAQQLMIDVTGQPFPDLMREVLFSRTGMEDSTFEQPLPAARVGQAASGTLWNGEAVPGKWHIYPEMAAGGLWTTPSDLARFAIEIALSKKGQSNRVLPQALAQEMLKPQKARVTESSFGDDDHPDQMGLGFFLGNETQPGLFGHGGDDAGFKAGLVMFGDSGQGAVVMVNSDNGNQIINILIDNIAAEYSWPKVMPTHGGRAAVCAALLALAQEQGTYSAIQNYERIQKAASPRFTPDKETLLTFGYMLLTANKPRAALEVMQLAVQEYPEYWNTYDSLADVYLQLGEKRLAVQNYEKAVALNPDNRNGIERLNELRAKGN